MSNVKQFGRRGGVRQSFGSNRITVARQPTRIPVPVIGLLVLGIFAAAVWALPGARLPGEAAPLAAEQGDAVSASFDICDRGRRFNCVIDGDTFHYLGERIRIADIDTPETHPARCDYEANLGFRATNRLRELLNAGPFIIAPYERDRDVYGRKLRIIMRDGKSLGMVLVSEGLARQWTGHRKPWCH